MLVVLVLVFKAFSLSCVNKGFWNHFHLPFIYLPLPISSFAYLARSSLISWTLYLSAVVKVYSPLPLVLLFHSLNDWWYIYCYMKIVKLNELSIWSEEVLERKKRKRKKACHVMLIFVTVIIVIIYFQWFLSKAVLCL